MHELIGHEIMNGREIAHIARVYDEGVFQRVGRIRRDSICQGISGQTVAARSWADNLAKTEASHASSVAWLSTGYPAISRPESRWRACPTCFPRYEAEFADEQLRQEIRQPLLAIAE